MIKNTNDALMRLNLYNNLILSIQFLLGIVIDIYNGCIGAAGRREAEDKEFAARHRQRLRRHKETG